MMGLLILMIIVGMTIVGFENGAPGIISNAIYLLEEMKAYNDLPTQLAAAIAAMS